MLTVYGIKTCDTVRKALKWLDAQGLEYTYFDVRKDGLEPETCRRWVETLGWEPLLNRRSTTWRRLTETERNIKNSEQTVALLMVYPTLIKRPVFEREDLILVGFDKDVRLRLS